MTNKKKRETIEKRMALNLDREKNTEQKLRIFASLLSESFVTLAKIQVFFWGLGVGRGCWRVQYYNQGVYSMVLILNGNSNPFI